MSKRTSNIPVAEPSTKLSFSQAKKQRLNNWVDSTRSSVTVQHLTEQQIERELDQCTSYPRRLHPRATTPVPVPVPTPCVSTTTAVFEPQDIQPVITKLKGDKVLVVPQVFWKHNVESGFSRSDAIQTSFLLALHNVCQTRLHLSKDNIQGTWLERTIPKAFDELKSVQDIQTYLGGEYSVVLKYPTQPKSKFVEIFLRNNTNSLHCLIEGVIEHKGSDIIFWVAVVKQYLLASNSTIVDGKIEPILLTQSIKYFLEKSQFKTILGIYHIVHKTLSA
jgi:hypothetical protein